MGNELVIVVGAGPAGLAAAFRLQQRAFQVTVLEAEDHVGGRVQSTKRDGFTVDRGATILPETYDQVHKIIADAGLTGEVVQGGAVIGFTKPDGIHYLDSDHLFRDAIRTKLMTMRSKLLMARLFAHNQRIHKFLSYEDLSKAAEFDTESAAGYAARRLNPELAEVVIDTTVRGILGTRASEVSNLEFFFSFNKVIGGKLLNMRDGMGSYPRLLAEHIHDIRLNARVLEVKDGPSDVQVTWTGADGREHVEHAAGCIVTLPANAAVDLLPDLDQWRRTFMTEIDYTTCVGLNVALDKGPPNQPATIIQVPTTVEDRLMALVCDHNKVRSRVPEGKGLMTVFAMADVSARLIDEDDDTVRRELLEAAEKVLPGVWEDIRWIEINRWYPAIVRSRPGYYAELAEFHRIRRARDRRVQLAGDYFSSSNVNTATSSGVRAARDLAAVVRPG
jgi:oxygen-dependent protoporphyrinogen oxidase